MTDISVPITQELEAIVNGETRAVAFNLLKGLIRATPVDTGRARGNWFVSLGAPVRRIDENGTATKALSEGTNTILGHAEPYGTITISNNLPYIQALNDGHSMQAPKKFVENEIIRVVNASDTNG